MPLSDLPSVFNAGVRELLGLNVPEDRLGCLQDIHWFCGAWGYFPTYTLGAMIAAQLFEAACEAEPDIPSCIRRGDFAPLLGWLRENVHEVGSSLPAGQILTCATAGPLDAAVFRAHLQPPLSRGRLAGRAVGGCEFLSRPQERVLPTDRIYTTPDLHDQ